MLPDRVGVIDTETTGIDPKTCKVVEVALLTHTFVFEELVNPGIPIPPETSAVHHICDADVEGKRSWEQVLPELSGFINKNSLVLVAHNAEYDRTVLGLAPDQEWICTYKCALRQWPDAPSHKNEVLKYWLGLGDRGRSFGHAAHSALHDCRTTGLILEELLKFQTLETLIQWSKEPKMFTKISFGKHAGKKWSEIDAGYLMWMEKQKDMDPDIVECARRELKSRYGRK